MGFSSRSRIGEGSFGILVERYFLGFRRADGVVSRATGGEQSGIMRREIAKWNGGGCDHLGVES